jgi:hypothetical protein
MKKRMPPPKTDREAYERLLSPDFYGFRKTEIADLLGVRKQAITRWQEVPLQHVKKLSQATGIPWRYLRPSDFT